MRCAAAPIRNAGGRVFAAISASGPTRRVTWERVPELAEMVTSHARQISLRRGWGDVVVEVRGNAAPSSVADIVSRAWEKP